MGILTMKPTEVAPVLGFVRKPKHRSMLAAPIPFPPAPPSPDKHSVPVWTGTQWERWDDEAEKWRTWDGADWR
jgi:hypothetical protein